MTRAKYPARAHAANVVRELFRALPSRSTRKHLVYLVGEITRERHDTDRELPFHQESNFFYLTGFDAPGGRLVIEVDSETTFKTTLFLADVDPDLVMWSGFPPLVEEVRKTHNVDQVSAVSKLDAFLADRLSSETTVHTLPWTQAPSAHGRHDTSILITACHFARFRKNDEEVDLIRAACDLSSRAHEVLMRNISKGEHVSTEAEAEALFVQQCRRAGAKHQAYLPIVAYGTHASTLHYVENQTPFGRLPEGALLLVDAGCEVDNYCADITRTIPVGNGGRFTKEGREIYELVLEMQTAAFAELKPGVHWDSIHLLMHKIATRGLLKLGLLKAGPSKRTGEDLVEELYEKGVSCAFFPHGLGHMLGLDVHDPAVLPAERATDPRLRYLRLRRPLEAGFVVTVEPGIYLNEFLVGLRCCGDRAGDRPAPYEGSKEHIDYDVLERYRYVGGVRIEDDVLITETGYENLTKAVKSVEEIERLCSGSG